MTKLIRVDEDHYFYLVDKDFRPYETKQYMDAFEAAWPGKTLIVIRADEFLDLTGQSEEAT